MWQRVPVVSALVLLVACSPSVEAPQMSQSEANKAIAIEIAEALETGDLAVLEKHFDPDGEVTVGLDVRKRGGPFASFRDAAPFPGSLSEITVDVEHVLAEGDKVAIQTLICGRQTSAMMGYEPTGKRLCSRYMNLYVFRDGRIISNTVSIYRDQVRNQLEAGLDL